jgi:hypothetical protein
VFFFEFDRPCFEIWSCAIIRASRGLLASNQPMILRLGYDIEFEIPAPVAMVALLNVHPSRIAELRTPDELAVEPVMPVESFIDSFGNRCTRFVAQPGRFV